MPSQGDQFFKLFNANYLNNLEADCDLYTNAAHSLFISCYDVKTWLFALRNLIGC